jgi:hypothetical protein
VCVCVCVCVCREREKGETEATTKLRKTEVLHIMSRYPFRPSNPKVMEHSMGMFPSLDY